MAINFFVTSCNTRDVLKVTPLIYFMKTTTDTESTTSLFDSAVKLFVYIIIIIGSHEQDFFLLWIDSSVGPPKTQLVIHVVVMTAEKDYSLPK